MSRNTIDRLIARGDLPRPIRLSPRVTAWLVDEIEAYIAARIAERDREPPT
jgi:predicted DNA-binding transcriptional regulator AlpA